MRKVHDTQRRPGASDIRRIRPTVKSRDDIPAIPIGLQDLHGDEGTRKRPFGLPGRPVQPGRSRRVGRPGMEPLTIPVPGVVKQGLGCDFDRLQELANRHIPVRRRPGHGSWDVDGYGYRRPVDNVSLLTPEFPAEVGKTVVERGHRVAGKSPAPRCAAAVIPSSPGPTCTIRPAAACRWTRRGAWSGTCPGPAGGLGPRGWRRKEHLCGKLRKGYLRVATSRLADPRPRDVEAPLRPARKLADRAEASRAEIDGRLGIPGPSDSIGASSAMSGPGGPDRTADPEGRDGPAPREGAPDIRAAHALDIEGQGRGPGGARRSGPPP